MKTIRLTQKATSVTIGRQGENKSTLISVDLSSWLDYFDELGTFSLWHQRFGEDTKYPVSITQDAGVVEWLVTSTDTAIVGVGKCEIVYTINDVIMKSKIFDAVVEKSITGEESETPPQFESWVNDVLSAADGIDDAVQQIAEYSEIVSENANSAAESAATATEAATYVQENIETAREAAVNAQASAVLASSYASQASDSMDGAVQASIEARGYADNAQSSEAIVTQASEETREKVEEMQQFFNGDVKDYIDNALQETKDYTDDVFENITDALSIFNDNIDSLIKVEYELNDINFFDYDGKLTASYTLEEAQQLETLPTPDRHDGLVFSGWNHTLAEVRALDHKEDIGAVYTTEHGWTHLKIYIRSKSRSTVPLYFSQTISEGVAIDWGDGSNIDKIAETGNVTITHEYPAVGYYTIKLRASDGCTLGLGHNEEPSCLFGPSSNSAPGARAYLDCLIEVNIGTGVTEISNYAFQNCPSLKRITIPESVNRIGDNAFEYCYDLEMIILPMTQTVIGRYAFQYCNGLKSIIGGSEGTMIGGYAFIYCYNLERVSLADGSILSDNAFRRCESLAHFRMPEGNTTVEDSLFHSCYSLNDVILPDSLQVIGNNAFNGCVSLVSVSIPEIVQISAMAFNGCYGIGDIHLKNTTPPTMSNINAFGNNATDRRFYVPVGTADVYKGYTNWSVYRYSILEEEDA